MLFDEVRFRDTENNVQNLETDYLIRIHRAYEDSGQGESERTNSAVGDASHYREQFYKMGIQFFMTNQTEKFRR